MSTQSDKAWSLLIAKVEAKAKEAAAHAKMMREKYHPAPTTYCRRTMRFMPLEQIADHVRRRETK